LPLERVNTAEDVSRSIVIIVIAGCASSLITAALRPPTDMPSPFLRHARREGVANHRSRPTTSGEANARRRPIVSGTPSRRSFGYRDEVQPSSEETEP